MEVNYGNGWEHVESYSLTTSSKTFQFVLPPEASNVPDLKLRFRATDDIAINGDAVQTVGTSRMFAIVISGTPMIKLSENPFRYAGEYFDEESGTYYLRGRQAYDPRTGRFTAADSHWNIGNMIYGRG